jgi:hypothetical protein
LGSDAWIRDGKIWTRDKTSRIRNPVQIPSLQIFFRFADIQIPRWKMFAMFCSMITFLFGGARLCEGDFGIPRQKF